MRVVVAEDVMLTREGITRLLTDAGVDVTAAVGDAAALLRAVGATQPDAAIIDIRMPPTHTDEGGRLVVTVQDNGSGDAAPMLAAADRVGALGGSLAPGTAGCRAEIPCAS